MAGFIGSAGAAVRAMANGVAGTNVLLNQRFQRAQQYADWSERYSKWVYNREFMYDLRGANQVMDLDSVATLRGQGSMLNSTA